MSMENPQTSSSPRNVDEVYKTCKETQEQLQNLLEETSVLQNLLMRYIKLNERAKNIDNILINILFFAVGLLLGFALALLFIAK